MQISDLRFVKVGSHLHLGKVGHFEQSGPRLDVFVTREGQGIDCAGERRAHVALRYHLGRRGVGRLGFVDRRSGVLEIDGGEWLAVLPFKRLKRGIGDGEALLCLRYLTGRGRALRCQLFH